MKRGPVDKIPFDVSYDFDENLRDVPTSPDEMRQAIRWLIQQLEQPNLEEGQRLKTLGRIGVYGRLVGAYDLAEQYLNEAITLSEQLGQPKTKWVNRLRLAHVYQWQGRYALSDELFATLVAEAEQRPNLTSYCDFVYQHAGKNAFDQGRYGEALAYFQKAHALRQQKGDAELLASTGLAIRITKQRMG